MYQTEILQSQHLDLLHEHLYGMEKVRTSADTTITFPELISKMNLFIHEAHLEN